MESFKATTMIFTDRLASDCFKLFKEKRTEEKNKNLSF